MVLNREPNITSLVGMFVIVSEEKYTFGIYTTCSTREDRKNVQFIIVISKKFCNFGSSLFCFSKLRFAHLCIFFSLKVDTPKKPSLCMCVFLTLRGSTNVAFRIVTVPCACQKAVAGLCSARLSVWGRWADSEKPTSVEPNVSSRHHVYVISTMNIRENNYFQSNQHILS